MKHTQPHSEEEYGGNEVDDDEEPSLLPSSGFSSAQSQYQSSVVGMSRPSAPARRLRISHYVFAACGVLSLYLLPVHPCQSINEASHLVEDCMSICLHICLKGVYLHSVTPFAS